MGQAVWWSFPDLYSVHTSGEMIVEKEKLWLTSFGGSAVS